MWEISVHDSTPPHSRTPPPPPPPPPPHLATFIFTTPSHLHLHHVPCTLPCKTIFKNSNNSKSLGPTIEEKTRIQRAWVCPYDAQAFRRALRNDMRAKPLQGWRQTPTSPTMSGEMGQGCWWQGWGEGGGGGGNASACHSPLPRASVPTLAHTGQGTDSCCCSEVQEAHTPTRHPTRHPHHTHTHPPLNRN